MKILEFWRIQWILFDKHASFITVENNQKKILCFNNINHKYIFTESQ